MKKLNREQAMELAKMCNQYIVDQKELIEVVSIKVGVNQVEIEYHDIKTDKGGGVEYLGMTTDSFDYNSDIILDDKVK